MKNTNTNNTKKVLADKSTSKWLKSGLRRNPKDLSDSEAWLL